MAQAELDGATRSFDVKQYFPEGSRWQLSGKDLAGNAFVTDQYYPVKDLPLSDGNMESDDGIGRYCLDDVPGEVQVTPTLASSSREIPALAGASSLKIDRCQATVRIARAANATQLRFAARVLGDNSNALNVSVSALQIGGSAAESASAVKDFTADAQLSTSDEFVSQLRDVTLPLPPGDADVVVSFDISGVAWIDSVRTE